MADIRYVVTRGYGNGVFPGSIREVVLRGYSPVATDAALKPKNFIKFTVFSKMQGR